MGFDRLLAGAVMSAGLLFGSIGGGAVLAQQATPPPTAQVQQRVGQDAQVQEPSYSGSITVDQAQYAGKSEADEAAVLQSLAKISADQAKAAAIAAYPGTTATKVELDNENGVLVYSVGLSNGLDVKVDAGNGAVVHTEQAGGDTEAAEASETGDHDKVQAEHTSQADDATEMPGTEDAAGQ